MLEIPAAPPARVTPPRGTLPRGTAPQCTVVVSPLLRALRRAASGTPEKPPTAGDTTGMARAPADDTGGDCAASDRQEAKAPGKAAEARKESAKPLRRLRLRRDGTRPLTAEGALIVRYQSRVDPGRLAAEDMAHGPAAPLALGRVSALQRVEIYLLSDGRLLLATMVDFDAGGPFNPLHAAEVIDDIDSLRAYLARSDPARAIGPGRNLSKAEREDLQTLLRRQYRELLGRFAPVIARQAGPAPPLRPDQGRAASARGDADTASADA